MPEKHRVQLSRSERQALVEVATTGKRSARDVIRAQILLKSANGWTDQQIAEAWTVSERTVRRIRRRVAEEGLPAAMVDKPRSGAPRKLTVEEEARLVALACSSPPVGRCRWTVRLLTEEAIQRALIRVVVPETVRGVLQKTRSSLGRSRVGAKLNSRRSSSKA